MEKTYKTPSLHRAPLRFDVAVLDDGGDVCGVWVTARHLRWHQYRGLDDLLLGEIVPTADPTGEQELKARQIKLKRVIERIENVAGVPEGVLIAGNALESFVDNPANADLIFATWQRYVEALQSPRLFRGNAAAGSGGGEVPGAGSGALRDAPVPGVRGPGLAASDGAAVPDRDGAAEIPDAGESGDSEAEAMAGAGVVS